jgi:dipeptidyl aminopeptidase/acylaminoacyl peptidase
MLFLKREIFTPHPYEAIREGVLPSIVAPEVYDSWLRKFGRIEDAVTERIVYESDGNQVTGLMMSPKGAIPMSHPLVIFNRGGRKRYGMLHVLTLLNLIYPLVQQGYIVLASNYRGVDGGIGGEDEFGGAEVNDILNLLKIGKKLPEWDGRNANLFGWSRGGMMTLLALKHGAEVNAAAVGAPLIDLTFSTSENSNREDWLQRSLPDYKEKGFKALEARSAPYWIPKLRNTPLLIMHGDADIDVSILHSRNLARKLAEQKNPHRLVEYADGNHYLNPQRQEVLDEVLQWFQTYRV